MPVYTLEGFDLPAPIVLADFPEALRRINQRASLIVLQEARTNAFQFHDTGALTRSIEARVSDLTVTVEVPLVQPTSAYANVMELGRHADRHPPPVSAIQGWVRRHGIPAEAAYVVARAIGRRGIQGRLYMRRAFEALEHQMPEIIDFVLDQMGI